MNHGPFSPYFHHIQNVSSVLCKLQITLPTSGGRSVGIIRSRTQTIGVSLIKKNKPVQPVGVTGLFYSLNHSSHTMALELTESLTEMSARNLPGGKGWPV
jgi:hypothetical protein